MRDRLEMTGCVLAGGRSTRMGRDKASLDLGGRTLAAIQVEKLRSIFAHVIASANDPAPFAGLGVEVVPDRVGQGPLAGIAAALEAAPTEHMFVCAVDMPTVSPALVRHLCALAPAHDIVVPRGTAEAGRSSPLEPAHAAYAKTCLPQFLARLAAGRFKVDAAFEGLRVRVVEQSEFPREASVRSFDNMNTPDEYRAALGHAEGRAGGERIEWASGSRLQASGCDLPPEARSPKPEAWGHGPARRVP